MDTVPLQIQVLEAEYCPVDKFLTGAGRDVRMGVEFNAIGQRTAYLIHQEHPNDWAVSNGLVSREPKFVPASEVMHVREIRRPGQIRGEPWLTRALVKLRDLDGYDDAELVRKKIAALFAGFVTSPESGDNVFTGEGEGGLIAGVNTDDDGEVVTLEPAR